MRVALLSDIHGNRQAFEAVAADIERAAPDVVWCLGDLVGYGADPDACVALSRRLCDLCLVGNHDLAVRGDLPLHEFSPNAALAARWTREHIGSEALAHLRTLRPLDLDREVGLFHASPRDPVWEYVLSTGQAAECLEAQAHRICFVGHSHVALSFGADGDGPVLGEMRSADEELDLSEGRWLLNPGSVGQPRDGDPRAAWLELDTEAWTARYRRIAYDVPAAQAAIRAVDLPDSLAERLQLGQ